MTIRHSSPTLSMTFGLLAPTANSRLRFPDKTLLDNCKSLISEALTTNTGIPVFASKLAGRAGLSLSRGLCREIGLLSQ